jgi:hypothetical protein
MVHGVDIPQPSELILNQWMLYDMQVRHRYLLIFNKDTSMLPLGQAGGLARLGSVLQRLDF